MLDVKMIVEEKEKVIENLKRRGFKELNLVDKVIDLSQERKSLHSEMESLKAEQNRKSKEMPKVMKTGTDEEKKRVREELKNMSERTKEYHPKVKEVETELENILHVMPNILAEDTPVGDGEEQNVEVKKWGDKREYGFKPKEHFELAGEELDFERGTKLSGSRFVVYKRNIAKLERALINLMMDTHFEGGYSEVIPPILVSRESMTATGQLPKFEDDAFKTTDDYFLIPTAEVSLVNLHRNEIVDVKKLPIAYAGYTPCFRREAGSYGKDTKGIIRLHQFNKVELVKFTKPENSDEELDKLLADAENILRKLNLHYRVVRLCTGDMGFGMRKTFDIEVWLPGQDRYREISSCSSAGDFQGRRAKIRFKRDGAKKTEFVHTLNGSGLAVGRTVVAILENYQNEDGSITVPEVLKPYMGGVESFKAE